MLRILRPSTPLRAVLCLSLAASAAACGDGSDGPGEPAGPAGGLLLGDGTPDGAELVTLWQSDTPREATDLDFDPVTGRLWVVLREPYEGLPCNSFADPGCAALEGSTVELVDPTGSDAPVAEWKRDTNAWHFMRRPTSIAFGVADPANPSAAAWFATCGEFRTGNFTSGGPNFMGPAHWTSDPAVYPFTGPGGNGSHLDMLHATPFCMGTAHEAEAVYWVFNGNVGAIDMYDFAEPHVAGGADHSDGVIYRYAEGEFQYAPEVMSHLDFHEGSGWLYVADSGNRRIARLDPASGTRGPQFSPIYEELADAAAFEGATVETVVSEGLELPSGLEVVGDEIYVADHATSVLYAYDLDGALLNQFDTGLPPNSLAGIVVGPDDKLYLADQRAGAVYRLEPAN